MKMNPFVDPSQRSLLKKRVFIGALILSLCTVSAKAVPSEQGTSVDLSPKTTESLQQTKLVNGVILDETGTPVIGVSVFERGTANGTITNFDGEFSLPVGLNASLQISYIGYVTQTVVVGNRTSFNIRLIEDSQALEEVVVIGYGTVKKRDLTGSVASVSSDKLQSNPVSDVAQALQGHLPGVSVTSQDGRPGAGVSIRVRGGGSITQSNEPLFVVDGFPVSDISDIPADQITSIDVLKDAASTAIYGARGANGVILVTTKTASEGKLSVSYNGYLQTRSIANKLDVLDAQDYVLHTWSYAKAMGASYERGVAEYFGLGSANGNRFGDYANVAVHDYSDDMLRTSFAQSHNINISGGNDKTKLSFSANYMDEDGIRVNSAFNRFNATLKVQQKITDNLTFDVDARYVERRLEGNGGDGRIASAYRYRPIDNPLGTGEFAGFGNGAPNVDLSYDAVALLNDYVRKNDRQVIRGVGSLTWIPVKGLTARTELGMSRNYGQNRNFEYGLNRGAKFASLDKSERWDMRSVTTLNYEFQNLGENHSLNLLAGQEMLRSGGTSSSMQGAGYPDGFDFDRTFGMMSMTNPSLGLDRFSNSIDTPNKTLSFFGRASYSFMGKYLLTATFRADGSSKFASKNGWGYFPAAAFAWRISDEAFLESTRDWMSNLKLRLSYGTSGADNINPSLWRETWETSIVNVDGKPTTTYTPAGLMSNPELKWETTISRNLGIDYGFLKNRINGTIDLYWNTTQDLLMRVPIDQTTGYSYQFQNIGETSNKGIEFAIAADIVRTKDFNFNISANYNYNRNRIEKLADNVIAQYGTGWASTMGQPSYDYVFKEGASVGLVRGFISDGFYTPADFNYHEGTGVYELKNTVPDLGTFMGNYPGRSNFNLPAGQNAFPGAMKIRNLNPEEDNIIDIKDVTELGSVMPKHTGGFNLTARYKQFDFNSSFAWSIGGKAYNVNKMINSYGNKDNFIGANSLAHVKNAYKIYDVNASGDLVAVTTPEELNKLNANANMPLPYHESGVVLSNYLEDASYLRMNTLTIGYSLPKQLTSKLSISRLRVYATGGNLFTITGYSGADPEVSSNDRRTTSGFNAGSFPTLGLDVGSYPRARTFTFGVNLQF